jgi:hypothetical protein
MSELADKYTTARFEKKAQPLYGPQMDPQRARRAYEAVRYRIPKITGEIQDVAKYLQQLEEAPPKSLFMPNLLAAGTGAGVAHGLGAWSPRVVSRVLGGMPREEMLKTLKTAFTGMPAVGGKSFASTVAGALGPADVAKLMTRENWLTRTFGKTPYVGDWLRRRHAIPDLPKGIAKAVARPEVKARLPQAAKHVAGKRPFGRTLMGGALAGIGAMYLPSILRWVKNRIMHGPGGTSAAEASKTLQQKLRQLEANRAFLATFAEEMRRARAAGIRPRQVTWGPFRSFIGGRPLRIPAPPAPQPQ